MRRDACSPETGGRLSDLHSASLVPQSRKVSTFCFQVVVELPKADVAGSVSDLGNY